MPAEGVRGNLRIYIYLRFLGEFLPIAPVLILYYTINGLSSTQVFTIQALFHLVVLLLEVPSGYLADVIGRKRTLVLGAVFMPLGMAAYAAGRSFAAFVVAESLLAVSISMRSGCDSALVFDSLRQIGRECEYKRYEGRGAFAGRTSTALSSVAGGLLAAVFLRLPFLINTGVALAMPALALSLAEPERAARRSRSPVRDIFGICRACLRQAHVRPVVLFGGLLMACHLTGVWAYFLLYRDLGVPVGWFGVLFAVFQLAGAWGGARSHSFSERFGAKAAVRLSFLSPGVFIALGLVPGVGLLPLIPINAFLWNLAYPVLLERLNLAVSSDVRATVLSLASMAGSVLFIVVSPLFGLLVDTWSLSFAFAILGAVFLLTGVPLVGAMFRNWRQA